MAGRKAGTASQTVRVLEALRALLRAGRAGLSAAGVGDATGVTQRQAQRDLDVLVALGVDVMQHDLDNNRRVYTVTRKQATAALLGGA